MFTVKLLQMKTEQTEVNLLQDYNQLQKLTMDLLITSLWKFVKGQNIQIKSPKNLSQNKL